jgi:23S rRNA pseudouridine1911/1915/1917 synthase
MTFEQTNTDSMIVSEEEAGQRLDKLLSLRFPQFSRTYFQSLIEKEKVLVNEKPWKKREQPQAGDEIEICFELTPELSVDPEDIPLEILYEDDHLLVINKPAGLVVHPAPGHYQHTFVNALLFHCKTLEKEMGDPLRPGIVHRLDKDTSGILIAAKTSLAHKELVSLFSRRAIQKTYAAICIGRPKQTEISAPIRRHPVRRQEMTVCFEKGKEAITRLQIEAEHAKFSFLKIDLITGRTHQIRVHLKHIGCPILGDPVYGNASYNEKLQLERQMLHAASIRFMHPIMKKELHVQAPLPSDMQSMCEQFFRS